MRAAFALRIISGRIIKFRVWNELPQSKPYGFASSLWEGAFGIAASFLAQVQSLQACLLPLGGAVAQRLRGYGWRGEKSVKAIAPTGAALAFLCFDFFFRIVKGEQPLTRCGVGGVQRQGGGSRNTPPCLWPSGASLPACAKQKLSPRSVHFSGSLLVSKENIPPARASALPPPPFGWLPSPPGRQSPGA